MTLKWKRRVHHHATWPLLTIALVSACGGGLLAVLQIVTPLGGDWLVDPLSDDEKLDFNSNLPEDVFFSSKLSVTAKVTTITDVCGGGTVSPAPEVDLVGTLENGAVVLRRKDPPKVG